MLKVFFACRIVLAANHQNPGNIQRLIGLLNCLSPMSSVYRTYSKFFSPADLSQLEVIGFTIYSKTFSPAELSQPQKINIAKVLKVFFACRIVLAANHQYPENTQRLFARRIVSAANHQYPGNIQRLFRWQSCLSRKSSIYRKCSKSFSPSELSQQQIINIPKMLKVFFACRIVLAANHQNPGNIQRLIGLLNCLSPMSSVYRTYSKIFSPADLSQLEFIGFTKYSKTFSPAELSQPQIINIPKMLKVFFAWRIALAANH